MTPFFETTHCTSRKHCKTCRDLNGGRSWREQLLRIFKTSVSSDFECPYGVKWGVESGEVESPIQTESRPVLTVSKVKSFAQAVLTGEYVSKEILKERAAICGKCEFLRVDPDGKEWCGICGCQISLKDRTITNLAAYKENLPSWGCKHRRRNQGFGWKR